MSIAKNRAKTLQEKFGFKDDDLKTPAHDAMMLWLDANIEQIVSEIFKRSWTAEEILKKRNQPEKKFSKLKKD